MTETVTVTEEDLERLVAEEEVAFRAMLNVTCEVSREKYTLARFEAGKRERDARLAAFDATPVTEIPRLRVQELVVAGPGGEGAIEVGGGLDSEVLLMRFRDETGFCRMQVGYDGEGWGVTLMQPDILEPEDLIIRGEVYLHPGDGTMRVRVCDSNGDEVGELASHGWDPGSWHLAPRPDDTPAEVEAKRVLLEAVRRRVAAERALEEAARKARTEATEAPSDTRH